MRRSMFEPIPQIFEAASNLQSAVRAHLDGQTADAEAYFLAADDPTVRQYNDHAMSSGWRARHKFLTVRDPLPHLAKADRPTPRMPAAETRAALLARDGLICRFCGVPLIHPEVRKVACKLYPEVVRWGSAEQDHSGFKALWLQFDHLLPNARGGESTLENMVVACAPCNYGRMDYTLQEAEVEDPRITEPSKPWVGYQSWDGLIALLAEE